MMIAQITEEWPYVYRWGRYINVDPVHNMYRGILGVGMIFGFYVYREWQKVKGKSDREILQFHRRVQLRMFLFLVAMAASYLLWLITGR